MVKTENINELENRLQLIKNQSQEEIKSAYQKQLIGGEVSNKGGAGLGMLQIAINSEGNLDYTFQDVDENKKFFLLEVRLKVK